MSQPYAPGLSMVARHNLPAAVNSFVEAGSGAARDAALVWRRALTDTDRHRQGRQDALGGAAGWHAAGHVSGWRLAGRPLR